MPKLNQTLTVKVAGEETRTASVLRRSFALEDTDKQLAVHIVKYNNKNNNNREVFKQTET